MSVGRTGGGGFVLVVGPSGAGKDTLLRLARARLAGDGRFVFARRLVTRPAGADEDNDEIGWPDFEAGEAAGAFALSWRAHGLGYAVPGAALDAARAGRLVVCNASRRAVAEARARLPGVSVVEVTAPPEVLAARLAARGRETEAEARARLAREVPPWAGADAVVANDGPPERGAAALVAHLLARAGEGRP